MSITPIDIHNKEFSVSIRGFNREEVNEFLDKIMKEYEKIIKDNSELKEKIDNLEDKLLHYQKIEETLQKAIVIAQDTAEEVKRNASKEAEIIVREAEKDSSKIIEEARFKASRILAEHEDLHKQVQIFKMRFRSMVEAQLSFLEAETWLDMEANNDNKQSINQKKNYEENEDKLA